ncbi:hypothetical protein BSKO_08737 [Bryopsis sp. KO-2023]|nr:hypothetical protein BSKO_08737 [Bryopsis sp. KO-2023]
MESLRKTGTAFIFLIFCGVLSSAENISGPLKIVEAKAVLGSDVHDGDFPEKFLSGIVLDHAASMKVAFKVLADTAAFSPHQAMIMLQSRSVDVAAYFVPKARQGALFSATITSKAIEERIGTLGGMFDVSVVVGDPAIVGGVIWNIGEIEVLHKPRADGEQPEAPPLPPYLYISRAKPEIVHQHRPAEQEAPASIAVGFSVLSLLPLVWLVATLTTLDHKAKIVPKGMGGIWVMLFHFGLAAFLCLIVLFWLKLNLLQTLLPLAGLSVYCIVTGHRALSALAATREKAKTD